MTRRSGEGNVNKSVKTNLEAKTTCVPHGYSLKCPTMEEVFKNQVEKKVYLVDEWMPINFFPQLLLGPFRNKVVLEAGTEITYPNKDLTATATDEGLISSNRDHFCKYIYHRGEDQSAI